jgi:hypothetical protein
MIFHKKLFTAESAEDAEKKQRFEIERTKYFCHRGHRAHRENRQIYKQDFSFYSKSSVISVQLLSFVNFFLWERPLTLPSPPWTGERVK